MTQIIKFDNILLTLLFFLLIITAFLVIWVSNPVFSVLFLILNFTIATFIFILLNAIFIALIFLMVYVGAIAVLFLFVVMMLNIDTVKVNFFLLSPNLIFYCVCFFLIYLIQFYTLTIPNFVNTGFNFTHESILGLEIRTIFETSFILSNDLSLLRSLSEIIFVYYGLAFLLSGLLLLLAMVGAIVLTLENLVFLRQQNLYKQISKNYKNAVLEKFK